MIRQPICVFLGHVDHGKTTIQDLIRRTAIAKSEAGGITQSISSSNLRMDTITKICGTLLSKNLKITLPGILFIDTPGHAAFSNLRKRGGNLADIAVLVIDANEGVQENSKRHGYMLSMLGISQVIVVINKMDLINYDKSVFNKIKVEYMEFLNQIDVKPMDFIPVSALNGDNVVSDKKELSWFHGKNILEALDSFEKVRLPEEKSFRMYVQDIYKFTAQNDSRRIIAGRIESGNVKVGDSVIFLPSCKKSKIKSIELFNSDIKQNIGAGYSVGFTLTEQIYISRGELMCKENENIPNISSIIKSNIFWMGKDSMRMDKLYKLKIGTFETFVKLNKIISVLNASNLSYQHKNSILRYEIANCILECKMPFAFDLFEFIQATGRFVIVDNYDIAGGGIIYDFTDTKNNIVWHDREITRNDRSDILGHKSVLLWLTGLSGSGKSTIAVALQKRLIKEGKLSYVLDGDNVRHGLNKDLGFSEEDRIENIRRVGEVASLFVDCGIITIVSFISPYKIDREIVRNKLSDDFIEIYVKCSLNECEKRDPKKLYKKARAGEIKNFTGITSPYEEPENPELIIETNNMSVEESVDKIYNYLKDNKRI